MRRPKQIETVKVKSHVDAGAMCDSLAKCENAVADVAAKRALSMQQESISALAAICLAAKKENQRNPFGLRGMEIGSIRRLEKMHTKKNKKRTNLAEEADRGPLARGSYDDAA